MIILIFILCMYFFIGVNKVATFWMVRGSLGITPWTFEWFFKKYLSYEWLERGWRNRRKKHILNTSIYCSYINIKQCKPRGREQIQLGREQWIKGEGTGAEGTRTGVKGTGTGWGGPPFHPHLYRLQCYWNSLQSVEVF